MDKVRLVKNFIKRQIAEDVDVDLPVSAVHIRPRSKAGNTLLAVLWTNVLQHPQNYPPNAYPYKKILDKRLSSLSQRLILKLPEVSIHVLLKCGNFIINGPFAHEWFKRNIHRIIENYLQVPQVHMVDYTRALHFAEEDNAYLRSSTADNFDSREFGYTQAVYKDVRDEIDGTIARIHSAVISDNWPADRLSEELAILRKGGAVMNGLTYIYPLWRSLLFQWFSRPDYKVFICSPHLDSACLLQICKLAVCNKDCHVEAIYTRKVCDVDRNVTQLRHDINKSLTSDEQLFVEYKVFSKLVFPKRQFHSKFIAAVRGEDAEVLVTSANFHYNHFNRENHDWVGFFNMPASHFLHKYIYAVFD